MVFFHSVILQIFELLLKIKNGKDGIRNLTNEPKFATVRPTEKEKNRREQGDKEKKEEEESTYEETYGHETMRH